MMEAPLSLASASACFSVLQRQLSGGAAIQGDQKFLVHGWLLPCCPWGCSVTYFKREEGEGGSGRYAVG